MRIACDIDGTLIRSDGALNLQVIGVRFDTKYLLLADNTRSKNQWFDCRDCELIK